MLVGNGGNIIGGNSNNTIKTLVMADKTQRIMANYALKHVLDKTTTKRERFFEWPSKKLTSVKFEPQQKLLHFNMPF